MRLNLFGNKKQGRVNDKARRDRKNIPLPLNTYNLVRAVAQTRRLTMIQAFVLLIENGAQRLMDQEAGTAPNNERLRKAQGTIAPILEELLKKAESGGR